MSDIRKYFTSTSTSSESQLLILLRVYDTQKMTLMVVHQAQVKWYVLSLVGSTTRNGKSLSHGYTMMKMPVVYSVVYAKNGPTQPPH